MSRIVKKASERRADIIKIARSLFETKQYEKTTMQDVMKALNIAKGTIYHYFASKEELLEAVIQDIVDEKVKELQDLLLHAKGNALEKIKHLVKGMNLADENEQLLDELHKPSNYLMHAKLLAVTLVKIAPLFAELIEQGNHEKLFNSPNSLEAAEFALAGIQFLSDQGVYPWSNEELIRRNEAFPLLLERILQAKSGSFNFLKSI